MAPHLINMLAQIFILAFLATFAFASGSAPTTSSTLTKEDLASSKSVRLGSLSKDETSTVRLIKLRSSSESKPTTLPKKPGFWHRRKTTVAPTPQAHRAPPRAVKLFVKEPVGVVTPTPAPASRQADCLDCLLRRKRVEEPREHPRFSIPEKPKRIGEVLDEEAQEEEQ